MPAYEATLLIDAPSIATSLGVGRVLVKAENRRLGLPSFKILGASWATYRAVVDHLGYEPEPWSNINELARRHLDHLRPFALAAATDGNHGRAVAFMARLLGFEARIFVPAGTVAARIDAIERENATVTVVDGDYDDTVARAALEASDRCLVIADTSWPGYEATPRRVIEGYHTIFDEIDDALDSTGIEQPQIVVVPIGVGALMAAAVSHYRARSDELLLVGVEPADADCVLRSARAGHIESVPGPHRSIMVGLNCGTPSPLAWPLVSRGTDWFVAIDDDWARQAMRSLAGAGVVAGETGAAALGRIRGVRDRSRLRTTTAGRGDRRHDDGLGPVHRRRHRSGGLPQRRRPRPRHRRPGDDRRRCVQQSTGVSAGTSPLASLVMTTDATKDLLDAWDRWCDAMKSAARSVVVREHAPIDDSASLAAGFRFLARMAAMGIDQNFENRDPDAPIFWRSLGLHRKMGGDNPDALYTGCPVDPTGTYRITGTASSAAMVVFTVSRSRANFGKEGWSQFVCNRYGDEYHPNPDGTFEVIASAEAHDGNWLPLGDDAERITVRQAAGNWSAEPVGRWTIERIDRSAPPLPAFEPS